MARHAVQGEVDVLVEALKQDRVPVLIVQETSQRDGDVSATGMSFSIVCDGKKANMCCVSIAPCVVSQSGSEIDWTGRKL